MLKYKIIDSPVGSLKIVVTDQTLAAILWDNEKPNRVRIDEMIEDKEHFLIVETEKQLEDYFAGRRSRFDLPRGLAGTGFQIDVWNALAEIPYGATCTYKEIAARVGRSAAFRAVGTAIGKNPISIVIPCHRVIASDGGLGGFAGGIDRKQILLETEKKFCR